MGARRNFRRGGATLSPVPPCKRPCLYYLNVHILYFLKRKFSENVLQNAPNCKLNKHYVQYAPILLDNVRSNTISTIYI